MTSQKAESAIKLAESYDATYKATVNQTRCVICKLPALESEAVHILKSKGHPRTSLRKFLGSRGFAVSVDQLKRHFSDHQKDTNVKEKVEDPRSANR
jgi:hypothetical protein